MLPSLSLFIWVAFSLQSGAFAFKEARHGIVNNHHAAAHRFNREGVMLSSDTASALPTQPPVPTESYTDRIRRLQVNGRQAARAARDGHQRVRRQSVVPTSSKASSTTASASATTCASCPTPQVDYGQCGGKTWTGPTCCGPKSGCVRSDDYYWQCQPGQGSCGRYTTTTTSSAPAFTPTSCPCFSLNQLLAYGQCGGNTWLGSSCCPLGYYCAYSNASYWQCVPGSGAGTCTKSSSCTCKSPVAASGKCGGLGYTGSTCCTDGYYCAYQNLYNSQCVVATNALQVAANCG